MNSLIVGVAATLIGLIWLGVLVVTAFNLVVLSVGLLAVLYLLDVSWAATGDEGVPVRGRR